MADQVMTAGSQLSVLVPEIWSQRYYDVLLAELPFNAIISRDYEGEIQSLGDTVKISSFPEFSAASDIAEDAVNDADAITVAQQSLVINTRSAKDFIITNQAQLQSLPAMDKLRELAVYSIMKKVENNIIDAIVPSSSSPDHQIAFDSGTTLQLADLLEAKELLDAQNVPMSDRHLVVGSAQANDIFNITGFTSSDFILAGSPLTTGELKQPLLGFMPHMTTLISDVVYLFHKSFMTIAAQQGMQIKEYDLGVKGVRATRINCDTLYGIKQLSNIRVVQIG